MECFVVTEVSYPQTKIRSSVGATMSASSLLLAACTCLLVGVLARYDPSWDSLDTRPLPQWYDDAKIGIFVHWGVFSVPSFGSEWFWELWKKAENPYYVNFMKENYPPNATYQDFASQFTAEFFDPEEWTEVFNASGAQYIVLTSKHVEGYTLWPSSNSWNWNSMDVGPKRDLVGDLVSALRTKAPHIHFGLYHSLYEWFNPLYLEDKANLFQTNDFVVSKTLPELYDIVKTYKPEIIWSDGDAEAPDWYWNATVFLAWLFNDSPVKETVVANDRWGMDIHCHHGSFYTCHDKYNPGTVQPFKWENCMPMDKGSWGYRRNAPLTDYLTIQEIITQVAETISCGGNILLNIGPTRDGRLPPIMEERLRQLGAWLGTNGGAIYGSRPWVHQNDSVTPGVWFTAKPGVTYAIVLSWPKNHNLLLASVAPTERTQIFLYGYDDMLEFKPGTKGVTVVFPDMAEVKGQWAWVLKMTGVNPAAPRG
ncbi:alpha-L-fucosidase-like [Macrobrachium rosenbergii]|uniref:alpha-L-fucosidase-like n=1 Tax=Macrobrachium rosenbergii TaxID=79674 RepID=UPI0034D3E4D4